MGLGLAVPYQTMFGQEKWVSSALFMYDLSMKKVWDSFKTRVSKKARKNPVSAVSANAVIIPASAHKLIQRDISPAAIKVLRRLNDAGYSAYLVGGGVRDLLLGKHPKDFDVATDASPEQIRKLFSNSRIIGRRFRLVHVRYGRDIIEVATFRGKGVVEEPEHQKDFHLVEDLESVDDEFTKDLDQPQKKSRRPADILASDNEYGTMEEDASRRDFTINALFYSLEESAVIDYCQGMQDLSAKQIRVIGNPEQRYREDPVRMLRAIRFAAKLNFKIEKESSDPISDLGKLLAHVPPARMYDELIKLIVCGHSRSAFDLLQYYGLFEFLFPQTYHVLCGKKSEITSKLINRALEETDARIASEKTINPAFMIAILLWQPLQDQIEVQLQEANNQYVAMQLAQTEVLREQLRSFSAPRRTMTSVREIWMLQYQLSQTRKYRILRAYEHPRFRAGYDFLLLRAEADDSLKSLAEWWTRFQSVDSDTQAKMINELQQSSPRSAPKKRRISSRHRRPHPRHRE